MDQGDGDRVREAIERISEGRGSLPDLEAALATLREHVPQFDKSNLMLSLERIVLAKRKAREIAAALGDTLGREQLVALVGKILRNEGTDVEIDASLELVERNVPHPAVSDLIFWSDEGLTPEQIVDRALAWKPEA